MGFLKDSASAPSIYTEIKEEPVVVRPMASKPQSIWVHKIQEVVTMKGNEEVVVRRFSQETCTANNRTGQGCTLCSTPDPLWHMLKHDEQHNRAGKRMDFPKSPVHLLPVFNQTLGQVEVLKGGNQLFEEMDKWYDMQAEREKDLRRCDWRVWKTGQKKRTKYESLRLDPTAFDFTDSLMEEAKAVIQKALQDRQPSDPARLLQAIRGGEGAGDASVALPMSAPTMQLPAQTPTFGQSVQVPVSQPVAAPVVAPPPPVVAASTPPAVKVAEAGAAASKAEVDAFGQWISQQTEFQGMGMINNLVPMMRSEVGHVDYHKLSSAQLVSLRAALEAKLASTRRS